MKSPFSKNTFNTKDNIFKLSNTTIEIGLTHMYQPSLNGRGVYRSIVQNRKLSL